MKKEGPASSVLAKQELNPWVSGQGLACSRTGFDLLLHLPVELLFPTIALRYFPLLVLWQLRGGICKGKQL